jgi:mannose-6-phosphate isomerase-like protein (cupin superfamily)
MEAFEVQELIARGEAGGDRYLEFLRVADLSAGVYRLPAGGTDPQSPHGEDEVYCVLSGRARMRVGGEDRSVKAGSLIYVPKQAEHKFHSIEEDLSVLVFFAPAEHTRPTGQM